MGILIPTLKTRNFSLAEVIHSTDGVTTQTCNIGLVVLGYLQHCRDEVWEQFGCEVPFGIQSGYRSPLYNLSLYRGLYPGVPDKDLPAAARTSNHIWRVENNQLIWAADITAGSNAKGITTKKLYDYLKDRVRGEVYYHASKKFLHIAGVGPDKEWIQ